MRWVVRIGREDDPAGYRYATGEYFEKTTSKSQEARTCGSSMEAELEARHHTFGKAVDLDACKRVYVLLLHAGYETQTSLLDAHVDQFAAEDAAIAHQKRIAGLVKTYKRCALRYDEWLNENPAPGTDICACSPTVGPMGCEACKAWEVVYKLMCDKINREEGYDPSTQPMPTDADETFYISMKETMLYGT